MHKPSRFTVLLSGPLTATPRLLAAVAGTRSIAADGGMAHARALGLVPELWVGDFDSTPRHLEADFSHVPQRRYPTGKDQTDGEIAIEAAIAGGASELILAGGLGGQTDHVLGHLALLLALTRRGLKAYATSGPEEAYPLVGPANIVMTLPAGSRLSLIALTDLAGLGMTGVRWPLRGALVAQGSSRTLSNVAAPTDAAPNGSQDESSAPRGDVAVSLTAGSAILFAYPVGS